MSYTNVWQIYILNIYMPKRCLSKCRKLTEAECDKKTKCFYTSGTTYKFCRLKQKYGMDPEKNCEVFRKDMSEEENKKRTLKILKRKEVKALRRTQRLRADTEGERTEGAEGAEGADTEQAQQAKAKAREVIGRFMRKTKHKRTAEFLKSICSDAGVCIAFGTYADAIKKHFGGFANFVYAQPPIKRIGGVSQNGFVHEINYLHRGYAACAVLKSARMPDVDNLMYEYIVGQYINKQNKRFPCFLETYGYYTYNREKYWEKMEKKKKMDSVTILKNLTLRKTIDYKVACAQSKYLAILIQHLKDITSLFSMYQDLNFLTDDLLHVLFQVYMPLALLKNNFTHYDLHSNNVYLYEPVKGSYIHFHYHISGQVVSFKSKYIVKIIDYGRSFFKYAAGEAASGAVEAAGAANAKDVYEAVCKEPECGPAGSCGYDKGFAWMEKLEPRYKAGSNWISSQEKNISHDLRLLNEVKENTVGLLPDFMKTMTDLVQYKKQFGTGEILKSGLPNKINNVQDAADIFKHELLEPEEIEYNEEVYQGQPKLGDLHVYDDGRPMQFTKA